MSVLDTLLNIVWLIVLYYICCWDFTYVHLRRSLHILNWNVSKLWIQLGLSVGCGSHLIIWTLVLNEILVLDHMHTILMYNHASTAGECRHHRLRMIENDLVMILCLNTLQKCLSRLHRLLVLLVYNQARLLVVNHMVLKLSLILFIS